MPNPSRRTFLESLGGTAAVTTLASLASLAPRDALAAGPAAPANGLIHLAGDGLALTPREYTTLLADLTARTDVAEDSYLLGGEVEAFEQRWAKLLGKETAVFIPSGTLANQLAVRALAGNKRRVIVPEMSHMYNDTGDACQTLSGLTLIPLAPNRPTFTVADIEAVLARTASGRVATDVGAIVIESPIRRLAGAMFDWDEMQRIATLARERGISMHLDGARLFIASAYTGIAPAMYAARFDTVYVSLWKYFNSGVGAIIAGPRHVLDGMHHTRRMFGGNLAVGWPAARVAGYYMDGFVERLRNAVNVSEAFYAAIGSHPKVKVERIPNGTNLARLHVTGADLPLARRRLAERGIMMPAASAASTVVLGVNESWNRTTGALLAEAFERALA